jgi:hypothetical protein
MIIDGTNGLTFNNATTQASAGCVLQVVSGTYNTNTSTTSTSYVDTGLSLSITPKFSNSKILVIASQQFFASRATNSAGHALSLVRNSTQVIDFSAGSAYNAGYVGAGGASSATIVGYATVQYLDSPATTSSTTYKLQGKISTSANSQIVYYQESGANSIITLMEIAG